MVAITEHLLHALFNVLAGLPGIQATDTVASASDSGPLVRIQGSGQDVRLQVKILARGYPRDLRDTAETMHRQQESQGPEVRSIIGAPSLSPGSRRMLQDRGIDYWDSGGSLCLHLPWGLYLVDRPAPPVREGRGREVFRGAGSRILRVLLRDPDHHWKRTDLARVTEVSKATVSRVLSLLERNLWGEGETGARGAPFRLHRPGDLLDAWAAGHSLRNYRLLRFHAPASSAVRLEASAREFLEASGAEYALTLEAGAARRAAFSTGNRHVAALVPPGIDWENLAGTTDFRPVERGENLLLLEAPDPAPLMDREEIEGFWVASPLQLYLDLYAWPRRGREQADHLRGVCLGY